MPKILKNKKVNRIVSKKKLKSKNRRKSNIRSKKLKSKKYQGVIQRKIKKVKGGMNGPTYLDINMLNGPDGNFLKNNYSGFPLESSTNDENYNIKNVNAIGPEIPIIPEPNLDGVGPFGIEISKKDKNQRRMDTRNDQNEIVYPSLTEDNILGSELFKDELDNPNTNEAEKKRLRLLQEEINELYQEIRAKENIYQYPIGDDALFLAPEVRIEYESYDYQKVTFDPYQELYYPYLIESNLDKSGISIPEYEPGPVIYEQSDLLPFEDIDSGGTLFISREEIKEIYGEDKLRNLEKKRTAEMGNLRSEVFEPRVILPSQVSARRKILRRSPKRAITKFLNGGNKSKKKFKLKKKNNHTKKTLKVKQSNSELESIGKNKKKNRLLKKYYGGFPPQQKLKLLQMDLYVENDTSKFPGLAIFDTFNGTPPFPDFTDFFKNLNFAIDTKDKDNDFEHDFTALRPEDGSLKKYFEGVDLEEKDYKEVVDVIKDSEDEIVYNRMDINHYNKRIEFIPLSLLAKKKRMYWEGHNISAYNKLVNEHIRVSISIVDAGKFVIGGYSKEGEDCSKHLSNIIDPATTGKNTSTKPYLLCDIFTTKIPPPKIPTPKIPPPKTTFEDYFIKLLLEFIDPGAIDTYRHDAVNKLKSNNYNFNFSNKLYFGSMGSPEWNGAQAHLANKIKEIEGPSSDVVPRSKKQMDGNLEGLLLRLAGGVKNIIFKELCKLMKYMGDKSHIVQAIIYILYLGVDNTGKKPKVIIKTLDRLLFKCVCQVIHYASEMKDKSSDKTLKEYFKHISENLGAMYCCNFTVANVFKKGIDNGKKYINYYDEMSSKWATATTQGQDLDKLGECVLYSNFNDRFKSINEYMMSIRRAFIEKIGDDPIEELIFKAVVKKDDVNSFMDLYNTDEYSILYVIAYPILVETGVNKELKFVNLFPDNPKDGSPLYNYVKENGERAFIDNEQLIKSPSLKTHNISLVIISDNRDISTFKNYNDEVDQLDGGEEDFDGIKIPNTDNEKYTPDDIYTYMESCRIFLETKVPIYRQFMTYKLYLIFYKKGNYIQEKYLSNINFPMLSYIKNNRFLPGYNLGEDYNQLIEELQTGKRGCYHIDRSNWGSRIFKYNSKGEPKKIKINDRRKYFPYFKIGMELDRKTYTVSTDYYPVPQYIQPEDPYFKNPWPVQGDRAFLCLADIRYAKDPSIFEKLSFINNLISDEKFMAALNNIDIFKEKLLNQLYRFIPIYYNDLIGFLDYYEAIREYITLNFKIKDSNGIEANADKVFDHLYKDLSPLFQEYLVEAYILGVPLIYCFEKDRNYNFNYDNGFIPLYITNHKDFELLKYDEGPAPNFGGKIKYNDPLLNLNYPLIKQELYLSNNDYKKGNLKSIFMSIRNLYEECKAVKLTYSALNPPLPPPGIPTLTSNPLIDPPHLRKTVINNSQSNTLELIMGLTIDINGEIS